MIFLPRRPKVVDSSMTGSELATGANYVDVKDYNVRRLGG